MPPSPSESISSRQTLEISFELSKRRSGTVNVSVEPDADPEQNGHLIIWPDEDTSKFLGFPECHATVRTTGLKGYGSMYGWIQMVKSAASDDKWEMDPIPITKDLNTPFVWFGAEPSLYDGPSWWLSRDLDWICHSFLAYVGDGVISKDVTPILGFEWGYWMQVGKVYVKRLRQVDLGDWDEQLELLKSQHEGWIFRDSQGNQT